MKRILEVGPGPKYSKGGIATVISTIMNDKKLLQQFKIDIHESYCEGNLIKRISFSIIMYLKFIFIYKKYDVFHIHMASYGSTFRKGYYVRFLKKRNKKVILHVHGGEYLLFYEKLNTHKKHVVENIWNLSDIVIVLSDQWKEKFSYIFTESRIEVVRNAIDVELFSVARNEIRKYSHNFLFLGKICRGKGVYDLIYAIKEVIQKYPNIKLYIAGNGETEEIQELIKKLQIEQNIELVGWIDNKEKIELLKKVGTVILPSYNEGLPMAILEGMAAGKVILSTTVGAIPEVVSTDINGILINPGDIDNLIKAMEKVINNLDFDEECSFNNLETVKKNFDISIMQDKIMNIYNKI